ncbi:PREDICTED: uncharacterized protein LOC105366163 [Ceratosolen solmsi marchali]|uniref:Uncharacterized protein LOC105366163 n=1 Tax=Ceratosolen solmsi marchali TaxID=326594 RepID=A0AAJ6YRD2_9HYME|nr:PREDICTED: uncharacterized protein LOC105366163 [Ceratosolen solmsi marchali]
MSGHYTNHTKALATSSATRVWNHHNTSQTEGIDAHSISLSEPTYNESSFYSQAIITCSHLSLQISHTKNPSWYSSSTLLPHTVDSLPKSSTPLLSLQMLVDNRQNQMKNKSERKDFFESVLSTDISSAHQKTCQEYQTNCTFRNADKIHENDILSSQISNTECHLGDPGLSMSVNLLPSTKNRNESNYNQEKNIVKTTSTKENEIIHDVDCSNILKTKGITPTITLISKLDRNIKDDTQEVCSDIKRKVNELNIKSSKSLLKRGRKGVDSLLEKLESCSKRIQSDNQGSTFVTNVDEKDTNSIRSMSPEYCKSRSPTSRDDDVISPSFSNDDSNDTKQRRKRKLGKPVRLSKELKLEHEHVELEITKPKIETKSEIADYTAENLLAQNSAVSSYTETNKIRRTEFGIKKINNIKIFSTTNRKIDERFKISTFDLGEICAFKKENNNKINNQDHFSKNFTDKINYKINMSQYLIHALKDTKCVRTRRSSECSENLSNINRRKRRKSCDDVQDFLDESITITAATNNTTAFNEVESQLEKMFAGIIETDKDFLKKTFLETEKPITLLLDEEQKENFNSEKIVSKNISKNTSSEAICNNNYKKKKKNISKMRSHKKKNNSSKEITDISMNNLHKDKSKPRNDKRSTKKQCLLKKKKKSIKINTFREIIYDSAINTSPNKYKGPVIQIKGSKNSSLCVQIVNTPREDDEERNKERRKTIGNGNIGRSKRLHFQNNLDYRGKVYNSGLFNSTLSIRYDAHTADVTWICVFCKRGPHFIIPGDSARPHPNVAGPHITPGAYTAPVGVLSDLFGPYVIGKDVEDSVMSADEHEITKEQKQGNKNKRSLRYAGLADQFLAKVCKIKKKCLNHSNIYMGMTKLSCDEQQWEVWVHEECIVWAAGVYITGGRISGLQDAVWDASQSVCVSCGLSGANIGCIKRGCKFVTHYCCALTSGWQLNINQFLPKCNIHRKL